MNAGPYRSGSLWILPDPWKTLCVSHRSLDGANIAPTTGPTGSTTLSFKRRLDNDGSDRAR
jgi:hypothetical protein